ncbi:LORF2 protein, partial [Crocuta crocuta]
FANDISDKGLVSKIYKELISLNTQKFSNPVKKWARHGQDTSPKKTSRLPTNTGKKCSTLLIIREIHIKTTMRYHLTPVRVANMNNSGNNRCWRGCGERGNLLHCGWECTLVQSL